MKKTTSTKSFMTRLEIQVRVKAIREELETRHKYGTMKMATVDGQPIATEALQTEMYALIYKMSKLDKADS